MAFRSALVLIALCALLVNPVLCLLHERRGACSLARCHGPELTIRSAQMVRYANDESQCDAYRSLFSSDRVLVAIALTYKPSVPREFACDEHYLQSLVEYLKPGNPRALTSQAAWKYCTVQFEFDLSYISHIMGAIECANHQGMMNMPKHCVCHYPYILSESAHRCGVGSAGHADKRGKSTMRAS